MRACVPRSWRLVSLAARALLLASAVAGVAACEVLVGDSLPGSIPCSGELASSCPAGQSCVSGVCAVCLTCDMFTVDAGHDAKKPPVDAGHDTGTDAGHDVEVDTGHDVVVPVEVSTGLPLGATCSASTPACATGLFCVDTVNLTGLFLAQGSICSETCCSDADCGGSNVCYGTTGGNYCVTPGVATKCGAGGCGTPCCSSVSAREGCAGSDTCALATNGMATLPAPSCGAFAGDGECTGVPDCTGATNDPCGQDSDCMNGVCTCDELGDCSCEEALDCCSASDCTGGGTCSWSEGIDPSSNTLLYRTCQASAGKGNGEHCTKPDSLDIDCSGGVCAEITVQGVSQAVCTEPCCTDADCTQYSLVCRPLALQDGTPPLLVCQPPPSSVN